MIQLPEGWEATTIDDCFLEIKNGTAATQNKTRKGVPVSRIETIQNNTFDLSRVHHIEGALEDLVEVYKYQEGDIAFSHINSYEQVGKTALYEGDPEIFVHGMNLLRLRTGHEYIYPKYARYFMLSKLFRDEVRQRVGHAVNQVSINQKNSQVPFILAPLKEQRRIVAKLEKLFSRVDAAQARLATLPRILRLFRQSILAAACSGRLTADWRDIKGNSDELPRGWSLVEFGDLIADGPQNGLYKPQSFYGSGTPIVRIDAFYDGRITNWADLKRLRTSKQEREQFALANGDILINRVNSPKFLGKTALIRTMPEASVYESNMMRLRLDTSRAKPNYAILYLRSVQGLEELRQNAKHAVNQSSINQQDVKAVGFPLPPLCEQQEIVHRVEALFKTADALEARYRAAKAHVDKLTQSILAKAFRGELVPQDPNDEPASVLLERIRKERSIPQVTARTRRRVRGNQVTDDAR